MSCCCGSIKRTSASAGQSGAPGSGLPPGVLDGDLLVWDDALQLWVPTQPEGGAVISFGAVGVLNGTSYLWPGGGDSQNTVAAAIAVATPIPFDCVIDRIHALHNTPVGTTDVTYTIQVDEVASGVSVVLNSSAQQGANLINTIAALSGDRIRLSAVQASGGTLAALRPNISVRLVRL